MRCGRAGAVCGGVQTGGSVAERPVGGHCSKRLQGRFHYNPDEIWQCRFHVRRPRRRPASRVPTIHDKYTQQHYIGRVCFTIEYRHIRLIITIIQYSQPWSVGQLCAILVANNIVNIKIHVLKIKYGTTERSGGCRSPR